MGTKRFIRKIIQQDRIGLIQQRTDIHTYIIFIICSYGQKQRKRGILSQMHKRKITAKITKRLQKIKNISNIFFVRFFFFYRVIK